MPQSYHIKTEKGISILITFSENFDLSSKLKASIIKLIDSSTEKIIYKMKDGKQRTAKIGDRVKFYDGLKKRHGTVKEIHPGRKKQLTIKAKSNYEISRNDVIEFIN